MQVILEVILEVIPQKKEVSSSRVPAGFQQAAQVTHSFLLFAEMVGGYAHTKTDYACIFSASVKDFSVISPDHTR